MKKRIIEYAIPSTGVSEYVKIESYSESKFEDIKGKTSLKTIGYFEGVFGYIDKITLNNRKFPAVWWDKCVFESEDFKNRLDLGLVVGGNKHPRENEDIEIDDVSHIYTKFWKEGDKVLCSGILPDTDKARTVLALSQAGMQLGQSLRCYSSSVVKEGIEEMVIDDEPFMEGGDFVILPSCQEAIPKFITDLESKSEKVYQHSISNKKVESLVASFMFPADKSTKKLNLNIQKQKESSKPVSSKSKEQVSLKEVLKSLNLRNRDLLRAKICYEKERELHLNKIKDLEKKLKFYEEKEIEFKKSIFLLVKDYRTFEEEVYKYEKKLNAYKDKLNSYREKFNSYKELLNSYKEKALSYKERSMELENSISSLKNNIISLRKKLSINEKVLSDKILSDKISNKTPQLSSPARRTNSFSTPDLEREKKRVEAISKTSKKIEEQEKYSSSEDFSLLDKIIKR